MEYARLGITDLEVSRIGFGCAPMGGYDYGRVNDEDSILAIHTALDGGINFFDTADVYGFGHAEEVLGKALGNDRKNAIVATKFGFAWNSAGKVSRDCSPQRLVKAIEDSLRRLGLDVIPLYQMHCIDENVPLVGTLEALAKCQKEGKVNWIGLSNVEPDVLEEAQRVCKVVSIQSSYNLLRRQVEENLLFSCRRKGTAFLAHTPLARGFLTGKYDAHHAFKEPDTRSKSTYFSSELNIEKRDVLYRVNKCAEKYNKTSTQIALRWILDNPVVTSLILGIKNESQVQDGFGAAGWNLEPDDYAELLLSSKIFKNSMLY